MAQDIHKKKNHNNAKKKPHYNVPLQYVRSAFFSFVAMPFWLFFLTGWAIPFLFLPRKIYMRFVVRLWARGVTFMEKVILNLHYEVRGREHLPADERCIVAAKHQSSYETFKIHLLYNDNAIILKKSLLLVPLWGQFLWKCDVIAIDRSSPKSAMSSINAGAQRMADQGRTIVIYPQGTRVNPEVTSAEMPYKYGVFKIHEATKLPVIPLATNSGCFWPKGRLLKEPGTVVFEFLPAVKSNPDRAVMMRDLEPRLEAASHALAEEAQAGFKNP